MCELYKRSRNSGKLSQVVEWLMHRASTPQVRGSTHGLGKRKSVREIADILQKPKSAVSDVIVKWKRRGCETAEKRTGRPKILGERSRRILKRVVKQNRKSSWVKISQEFQSSSGISVISRTDRRELEKLGSHGRAAAHKPNITPQNAKHRLQWCRAHRHWTVDMWKTVFWSDESRFTVWQSDGLGGTFL
ncbi:uncharacterized protein TNCV_1896721 [Trichonephila clavipes]|nr:uncharacterized protein TNCV_1896721 [Trichonephila clavipes]